MREVQLDAATLEACAAVQASWARDEGEVYVVSAPPAEVALAARLAAAAGLPAEGCWVGGAAGSPLEFGRWRAALGTVDAAAGVLRLG